MIESDIKDASKLIDCKRTILDLLDMPQCDFVLGGYLEYSIKRLLNEKQKEEIYKSVCKKLNDNLKNIETKLDELGVERSN